MVTRANLQFFKTRANLENRKVQAVLRTPTGASLALAFNRDLTLVTHTVWVQHRALILAEVDSMCAGIFPKGMNAGPNDKIRCAYCPRLLKMKGVADHVVDKHKDKNPNTIPGIQASKGKHCPDCPDSKCTFNGRAMKDHQLNKHRNPNHPLAM